MYNCSRKPFSIYGYNILFGFKSLLMLKMTRNGTLMNYILKENRISKKKKDYQNYISV
jgi:hypothetical protein